MIIKHYVTQLTKGKRLKSISNYLMNKDIILVTINKFTKIITFRKIKIDETSHTQIAAINRSICKIKALGYFSFFVKKTPYKIHSEIHEIHVISMSHFVLRNILYKKRCACIQSISNKDVFHIYGTKESIPHLVLHHIPRLFNSGAIMRHELSRILHSPSYKLTING